MIMVFLSIDINVVLSVKTFGPTKNKMTVFCDHVNQGCLKSRFVTYGSKDKLLSTPFVNEQGCNQLIFSGNKMIVIIVVLFSGGVQNVCILLYLTTKHGSEIFGRAIARLSLPGCGPVNDHGTESNNCKLPSF